MGPGGTPRCTRGRTAGAERMEDHTTGLRPGSRAALRRAYARRSRCARVPARTGMAPAARRGCGRGASTCGARRRAARRTARRSSRRTRRPAHRGRRSGECGARARSGTAHRLAALRTCRTAPHGRSGYRCAGRRPAASHTAGRRRRRRPGRAPLVGAIFSRAPAAGAPGAASSASRAWSACRRSTPPRRWRGTADTALGGMCPPGSRARRSRERTAARTSAGLPRCRAAR